MSSAASPECIRLAREIQAIPAPTFAEHERVSFVAGKFRDSGLTDVEVVTHDGNISNAYGRLPGKAHDNVVVVCAHADTVFPAGTPLDSTLDGEGRLHGPGIGDNSVAVAALAIVARRLAARGDGASSEEATLPCDVWFVCNAAEEGLGDLRGMHAAIEWIGAARIGAAIVLEGMAFGCIYHRGIAVRRHAVTLRTRGGHSWGDFGGPSAIHELMRIGARVAGIEVPAEPKTTFNIGVISGGTSVNTIAGSASMEVDLRSESVEHVTALEAEVLAIVDTARSDAVTVETHPIGNRPAGAIPREHPLVEAATRALSAVGVAARFPNGSTDVNALLHAGVAAVCVGITTGANAHRADEWIDVAPVERGVAQVEMLVREAARIVGGGGAA